MGKPLNDEYRVGQVVVSKRGKDAGQIYVIVGFLGGKRLALADAVKFNVDRPKSKNPKHVAPTPHVMSETAACVEAGKNINRGELCRFLESVCVESKRRGRAANGE
jgi:ribosomal protein L14E/L6E/L27E